MPPGSRSERSSIHPKVSLYMDVATSIINGQQQGQFPVRNTGVGLHGQETVRRWVVTRLLRRKPRCTCTLDRVYGPTSSHSTSGFEALSVVTLGSNTEWFAVNPSSVFRAESHAKGQKHALR
jgi:hypothetical protein